MQAELSRTEKVARIFAAFDRDGDGVLSKVDIQAPCLDIDINSI